MIMADKLQHILKKKTEEIIREEKDRDPNVVYCELELQDYEERLRTGEADDWDHREELEEELLWEYSQSPEFARRESIFDDLPDDGA